MPTTPGDVDRALSRVARGGILGGVGAMVSGLLSFVVVIAVTRGFPAETAGSLFAASSVFLIVVAIVELGVDTGLLHWLPRYEVARRWDAVNACLRVALIPTAVVSALGGLLLVLVGDVLTSLTASGNSSGTTAAMLRVMAVFVPVAAMHDLVLATTRAYRTMRPTVLVERIARSLLQVAAVVVAYAAGASDRTLALAWVAPYLPALLASIWWARRLHARHAQHVLGAVDASATQGAAKAMTAGEPVPPGELSLRAIARGFWSYTLPRAGARICQVALQRADIVLVAIMRSPREAAIYTAATRFLVLGQLAVQAIQQVMQPHLSRALARGDRAGAGRLFRVSTVWIVAATWPPYLLMVGYSHLALKVFGSGYSAGEAVLVLLALTMLLSTAAGPVDVVLTMAGHSSLSLGNSVVALAADLGLDVLLIPRLGIKGAAIGWAVAIVLRNVLPLVQVHRRVGLTAASPGLWWAAASAAACFGVLPLLLHLTVGETLAVVLVPVPIAAYCWLLWRRRDATDLVILGQALRRRPAAGSALSEAASPG
ncbi:MAG: polysaccharide biosynthesis C-terminal domain-containing protein [Frankiaceae bacterium]